MKKIFLIVAVAVATLSFSSCCNENKCDNKEADKIHEGRISTHTTKTHSVNQDITPEERELVKEHITNETAPGVSSVNIDSVGAQKINDHRTKN